MPVSFIYFDLGNVLLAFCHDRMCRQMAQVAGVEEMVIRQALFEGSESLANQWRFERGDLSAEAYYDFFCCQTGTQPDREPLELASSDIFEELKQSTQLVESLAAAGNRLGILSNIGPLHWQFVSDGRFPLIPSAFECTILSYEVRSIKPEPSIYRQAIARAGVPAAEIFFVDDRKNNVAGAHEAGIDAILFTGIEQLASELRTRGVSGAAIVPSA
jgi:glucose-1-phosphatase